MNDIKNNYDSHRGDIRNVSGTVGWESPANIALVKYWGKYPVQLPMNPSLSFVLKQSVVRIYLEYSIGDTDGAGVRDFTLNGAPNLNFQSRIGSFILSLQPIFPFLSKMNLSIRSESTFPHSAGIASSAAAFSALSLCLCSIESLLYEKPGPGMAENPESRSFLQKASYVARLGSGSACRSLQSGFVVWGRTGILPESSDEYAVGLPGSEVAPVFNTLRDAILVVDDATKKVSSSAGHALMNAHAYREARKVQAADNLEKMVIALKTGDESLFFKVLENEALSLHSLMMSSNPGYLLMRPATVSIIENILDFRQQSGIGIGFTLDAGPNIHLLYFERDRSAVKGFIEQSLLPFCSKRRWIDDGMGNGPRAI